MKAIVLTDEGLGVIEAPDIENFLNDRYANVTYKEALEAALKQVVLFKDQKGTMKDCYNLFDAPYIEKGKHYPVPEGYEIKDGYACELGFPCECKFPEDHGKECKHRYAILVPKQELDDELNHDDVEEYVAERLAEIQLPTSIEEAAEKFAKQEYPQGVIEELLSIPRNQPVKQQTPLHKIKQIANDIILEDKTNYALGHNTALRYIIAKIESLLPEEKQMVIDVWDEATRMGFMNKTGEHYFNETFES